MGHASGLYREHWSCKCAIQPAYVSLSTEWSTPLGAHTKQMASWVRMYLGDLGLWLGYFSVYTPHTPEMLVSSFPNLDKSTSCNVCLCMYYSAIRQGYTGWFTRQMCLFLDTSLVCFMRLFYLKSSITKRCMYVWGFPLFSQAFVFCYLYFTLCVLGERYAEY